MANVVITTTANRINVVFNDASSEVGMDKGSWRKDHVLHVQLKTDHVEVQMDGSEHRWEVVDAAASNYLVIDTIDGAGPTSLSDLYDKLIAML
jgi:hypothetical protein